MEFHEVANIFPLLQDEDFEDFCQDIKQNGLLEPIWIHSDGRIIDGRNRYNACMKVGIKPEFRTWNGQGSLVDFVLSLNLHRRHLTSGQRAVLALEVEPFYAKEAKDRLIRGAEFTPNSITGCGNISTPCNTETDKSKARDQAAKATGTNGRYVSEAKRLKREAPAIFEQVRSGEMSIVDAKKRAFNYKRDERSSRTVDIYEPQGYDACQTPAYAIDPILPFLDPNCVIWEPAAGEHYLVDALYDSGFKTEQIITSDILTGLNFFEYLPDKWDCLITNPPYSIKYQWLERCYQLGKPFALLLPVETLGAKTAQEFLKEYGFEIMLLNKRVDFKMPNKGWDSSAQFPVFWLCWQLLPQQIMFGELNKSG